MTGLEYFIIANPILTYAIIFLGLWVEGEGVILLASIFAWQGHLDWGTLILISFAGVFIGDVIWYLVGRHLKETRLGRWLGKKYERAGDWMDRFITDHYAKFSIVSRFMYFTTHPMFFLVGWHEYPFKKFLWVTFYSSIIWLSVVFGVGYFFGLTVDLIGFQQVAKRAEILALILFVLVFVVGRLLQKRFAKRLKNQALSEKN